MDEGNRSLDFPEVDTVTYLKTLIENISKLKEESPHLFKNAIKGENGQVIYGCDQLIKEVEQKFDQLREKCEVHQRGQYWYLFGKLYMASPNYLSKAIDCLARSVKLEPSFIDGWNELGECYWQTENYKLAKSCFLGALREEKNKVSLRNLSMVLRKAPSSTAQEHFDNIRSGVTYAKDAVEMDPTDCNSWTVLGNAYLAAFFTFKDDKYTITQALGAYKQAEKYPSAKENQDLFYNKGVALKYEENYSLALEAFGRAHTLHPAWSLSNEQRNTLVNYLNTIQNLDRKRGKLSAKRLKQMLQSLEKPCLGPYSSTDDKDNEKVTTLLFLSNGINIGKILVGKVLWSCQIDRSFPFTFGIIDKDENTGIVTVYNMAPGKGVLIGDSVAIPNPNFERVNFFFEDKGYSFLKVRVDKPVTLIVNNRFVPTDIIGYSFVSFQDVC